MKNNKYLFALVLLAITFPLLRAKTIYNTQYNQFKGLSIPLDAQLSQGCLVVDNPSVEPRFLLDTTPIDIDSFNYYLRIANAHNKEGKHYPVYNRQGKKIELEATSIGIVFNFRDKENYNAVKFECSNTFRHNDILDRRIMQATVVKVVDGNERVVASEIIENPIKKNGDFNVIGINVNDGELTVLAGESRLLPVFKENLKCDIIRHSKIGCYMGSGAKVELERSVLSFQQSSNVNVETAWTVDSLNRHFEASKDPFEGYWVYLDREMEDKWLRLGGRYTIALVKTTAGYDVIYVDGAQVKKSNWRSGQLKGRLKNTIFTDHYDGLWVDATFRPFSQDVYADFESGVILTLKFPVYNSQVRFSKVLDKKIWPRM